MKTKYPQKANLAWVSEIRNQHIGSVLVKMMGFYLAINILFSIAYYYFNVLEKEASFFDYIYFSFVTSLAIGYGDLVPATVLGKLLVIIHSCITALYFALMISVLSVKMLYPNNLVRFSKKIIYNPETDMLIFRVINTNKEPLINPELRISVAEHNIEEKSTGIFTIETDFKLTYLGKLDFLYTFNNTFENFNVFQEAKKAAEYNKVNKEQKSRFRIRLSITGSYGIQQTAVCKKYYAEDIVEARQFKSINYGREVYMTEEITYSKIENFWEDFETEEQ